MLLLSLLLSCGPKIPLHLQDPIANPHPNCAPAEHIVGLGFSLESISDAQQNARNRVVEQVSSHIETVQTQRKKSTQSSDGSEENHSELVQHSTVLVNFTHYELVQDVGEVFASKDGFRALACLNTSKVEESLLKENASLLTSTEKLARETLDEENVHAFAVKRQKFHRYMGNLHGFFVLVHSLNNQYSMQELNLRSMEDMIENKAKIMRQKYTLLLQGNVSEEYQQSLQESMRSAGLKVDKGEECKDDVFLMILDENITPTEGPMGGMLTTLKIRATIQNCKTKEEQQIVLVEGKGYHSNDIDQSVKEAWKSVDTKTLPSKIGSVFPIMQ